MTCEQIKDPITGEVIGWACGRDEKPKEPLKEQFKCKRRIPCAECGDLTDCYRIAKKFEHQEEI